MKYLIFGSAWYIEKWCEINKSYLDKFCLVAINNSAKVVFKHHLLHRWYVGTDFFAKKYYEESKFDIHEYCNYYKFGYPSIISGDFLTRPYGYYCPLGGTMILNVCYDLLNKCMLRHEKCTIGIIGCDLIYNKTKSHFYDGGSADPLRLGENILKTYLHDLKKSFIFSHNKIFNLSDEPDTLLPFDKITIGDFYNLHV